MLKCLPFLASVVDICPVKSILVPSVRAKAPPSTQVRLALACHCWGEQGRKNDLSFFDNTYACISLLLRRSQPSYFLRMPEFGLGFPFHLVEDQTHVCMCISMLYPGWCVWRWSQSLLPSAPATHLYPESCLHILDEHALSHHKTGTNKIWLRISINICQVFVSGTWEVYWILLIYFFNTAHRHRKET